MKKLNKRERILSFVIVVLLLLFIFKLLIFDPIRQKLNSVEQEIERAQLMIRKYLELGQHREAILKGQKQIERYLGLKGSDGEKMAAILSKIELEARRAGLSILDMNPVSTSKVKSMSVVYRVQLRAEAELVKFFDFIYNLENADTLFKIDKVNLSAKDESTKVLRIEASILGISIS